MKTELQEFASSCLWYLQDGGAISLGVTEKGLRDLGTILEFELPEPGETFEVGDDMGAIIGRDSDLRIEAPIALKILERNHEVISSPVSIEDDPTGDGWLLRCEEQ